MHAKSELIVSTCTTNDVEEKREEENCKLRCFSVFRYSSNKKNDSFFHTRAKTPPPPSLTSSSVHEHIIIITQITKEDRFK